MTALIGAWIIAAVLFRKIGIGLLSKVFLAIAAYSTVSLIFFDFGFYVPFQFASTLEKSDVAYSIAIYIAFAGIYESVDKLVGRNVLFVKTKIKSRPQLRRTLHDLMNRADRPFAQILFMIGGCASGVFVLIAANDVSQLWIRNRYQIDIGLPLAMRLADVLLWLGIVLTSLVRSKFARYAVLLFTATVFIGLGSRSAILYMIGCVVIRDIIVTRSLISAFLKIAATTLLGSVLIDMRSERLQGIAPLFDRIVSGDIDGPTMLFFVNYLSTYSVLILTLYRETYVNDYVLLLQSISPLPGSMVNVDAIDAWARYRRSIPYPAIGQIYSHVTIGGLLVCAAALALFKKIIIRLIVQSNLDSNQMIRIKLVVIELVIVVPVLIGLQYNLRTSSRMFYLILGLSVVYYFTRRMRLIRA